MPIPRAGPYASPTDSFIDDPSFSVINAWPVNCADYSGSIHWPWRYYYISGVDPLVFEERGPQQNATSITEDFIAENFGNDFFEGQGIQFAYQAAQDVTLTGSYSATALFAQGAFIEIQIYENGDPEFPENLLFEDGDFSFGDDNPSISGNFSVTLPATTLPRFVQFLFSSDSASTGSITINLTPSS
jgi:hypothetical protein